ncbi:MAG TPA: MqnA/MqnD/SBP family protein [Rhodothermales bacterium]|nr:MqnA/MqnD/SBP family protein [Rhodothermales bacterium]
MQLALWDTPAADFFVAGLEARVAKSDLIIERQDPRTCVDLLRQGLVDMALVPSLVLLSSADILDALPGAALSTWTYPYAQIVLRKGLGEVKSIAFDPLYTQEALVARIVLKEHYGKEPTFIPIQNATLANLEARAEDAFLYVGDDAPLLQSQNTVLNLGQEWYELASYPMVWGLFAARKDEATPAMVEALVNMVGAAETQRPVWLQAHEMTPEVDAFFREALRLRFDDLVTASLTELRQYLFYYQIAEDIPDLPLYVVPDDGYEDDEQRPLL